ncbi:hypothetical protein [Fertoeibacter niger]|nr:hypothetical protein [Fertoeibacter niger]
MRRLTGSIMHALRQQDESHDHDRILTPLSKHIVSKIILEKDPAKRYDFIKNYYDYARKEIEREDDITYKRLNLTLIFQGFIITSFALMVNELMKTPADLDYLNFFARLSFICAISILGASLAFFSFRSVESSRRSLLWAKDQWVIFNRINDMPYPSLFPQLTKRSNWHSYEPTHDGERKQLTDAELEGDSYFSKGAQWRSYKDEGWDFALAIPSPLILFWLTMISITSGLFMLNAGKNTLQYIF